MKQTTKFRKSIYNAELQNQPDVEFFDPPMRLYRSVWTNTRPDVVRLMK